MPRGSGKGTSGGSGRYSGSQSPSRSQQSRGYQSASTQSPMRSSTQTKETIIIRESPRGRQPGLFGTMAATAGGVAIGSAVGHAVGEKITGGGGAPQQYSGPSEPTGPCAWEIKQFLQCAATHDVTACEGFNEAIKACKAQNGLK